MTFVIETKKLTKIYGEQTAVNSVDIHVKPGRIYGLLGRNAGAGKTTIMKMILGLTPITSGEVDVFGQNIKGHEKRIYPPHWSHHRNARLLPEPDRHRKP